MPNMVERIARSDPDGRYKTEIDFFIEGGATLEALWDKPEAQEKLQMGVWNFLVLQPQSDWAQDNDRLFSAYKGVGKWSEAAREKGIQPVLFMTWPRQPETPWYDSSSESNEFFGSPEAMYQKITISSNVLAKEYAMSKVPITDYWVYMLDHHPEIPLYAQDGSHPSVQASYMIALLFYKMLTQSQVHDVTYAPSGVSAYQREVIKALVEKGI
jgi:hypothetical protein